jgi:hypothetical protein
MVKILQINYGNYNMEHKVIITDSANSVNILLKEGWLVKSVTAQFVATGGGSHLDGKFCFVLEKE